MLDKKMLSLALDEFRTIFHLPQANDNNHDSFVPPPSFLDMVPFYKHELGFTMELKTSLSFKTTGLLQPWQTLCKIFSKCLTTRVTRWDQPLFTKIIISHYMTNFPEISRRARDIYHNLKDDDIMKNIFNSGRHKDRVGMKILDWMISDEMKHTEPYRMYAEVFGIDVPLTQSQPTEYTQGTHRDKPIAPRRSICLTPPAPVPTINKADEMILQDTLQVSLVEHKSREEQEARENVEMVNKPLESIEIEKMVEESENESSKVEITNVVIPVNVNEEEEEITDEVYELKRREKGKIIEESRSTPSPTPIRSPRIHTDLVSSDTEKLQELTETDTTPTPSSSSLNTKLSTTNRLLSLFKAKPARFKCYKSFFQELQGRYGYLFEHLKAKFLSRKSFDTLADHLQEVMVESLPTMVDKHIKEQVEKQVPEQVKVQVLVRLHAKISSQIQQVIDNHISSLVDESVPQTTCRTSAIRPRDQDDPHDDAPPEEENSAKRQKTSTYEYEAHVTGESSEQSYALDDDEIPTKQVSQDIMEEVSLTINEESRKEILASPHPRKTTHLIQSCQRYPEALTFSLINQDLLYLKKGNSGPEKIVLSLHKFPAIIFNDVDIEERTSRWIFYIKRQKEPRKPTEVVYSNSKIIQVITEIVSRRANECIVSITESDYKNLNKNDIEDIYLLIMNGKVPDYAETGLLWSLSVFIRSSVIWERVHDFQLGIESYQQKVNLTAPTISFPGIEKHKNFFHHYESQVLEGLKSYNNDVKYGYIQRDLTEDEVEYLKLFEEEIEVRLKYRNQMRRWEMYVNGRPLGPRREHPE
ncbi:hypothetical protein Tco_0884716 [Tanacetum coccineum]